MSSRLRRLDADLAPTQSHHPSPLVRGSCSSAGDYLIEGSDLGAVSEYDVWKEFRLLPGILHQISKQCNRPRHRGLLVFFADLASG